MFEQFSSSYYLGRLYVEPRAGEPAQMCREQHQRVNRQLYGGHAAPLADQPLVMKLGTRHFPVRGGEGVPADTIAVPRGVLDDVDLRNPPTLREVLLANADRAAELLRLTNGVVPDGAGPADADGDTLNPGSPGDDPDGPAGI